MLLCVASWDHLCVGEASADDTEPGEQSGNRAASAAPAPVPAPASSGRRTSTTTDAAAATAPEPKEPHERAAEAPHAAKPSQGTLAVAILIVVLYRVIP